GAAHLDADRGHRVQAEAAQRAGGPLGPLRGARLQPVVDGDPAGPQAHPGRGERGGAGQRQRVGAAAARDQDQGAGGQAGQRPAHRPPDIGDRRRRTGHAPSAVPLGGASPVPPASSSGGAPPPAPVSAPSAAEGAPPDAGAPSSAAGAAASAPGAAASADGAAPSAAGAAPSAAGAAPPPFTVASSAPAVRAAGRTTRAIQASGSRISARVGSVSGDSQTRLKSAMPTWATTLRTNAAPSSYCFILRSRPSSCRMIRSIRLAPSRRRWNRRRISATEGTTSGPTASIT